MQTAQIAAPPTVQVGGKSLHVHFSNGAFYLLSTWGIDITQITSALNERFASGRYTEAMYKLAAAGLGTMDAQGNWETLGLEPLKLADRLKEGESAALMDTVWKAFSGKLGLVTTTAAPEPAKSAESTGQSTGPLPSAEPASE